MPRVKLGAPSPAQQRQRMNKLIRSAMVQRDICDCTALAAAIGMDPQAVRRRMRQGGWKVEELWQLVRVLQLTAEQAGLMLGGRQSAS